MLFFYLLTQLDIEFLPGQEEPVVDERYFGVGATRPKTDLKIRYRLKSE